MSAIVDDDTLAARGLAANATDLDMITSPLTGELVPVAMHHGVHVCWGCFEPFDPMTSGLALVEMRPPGSVVKVGVHAKCVNPKNRKIFSDMGGSTALQSVEEVSRGLAMRKRVARIVKASADIAAAAAEKLVTL